MKKRPLCAMCLDAARESLAQELREGLRKRGLWAGEVASDLISAVFAAIDPGENCVRLRISRESWALLKDTLEVDSQSASFDRVLRERIKAALDTVKEG